MAIATAPNAPGLQDSLGRHWAIQVKPRGGAPTEYKYVPGIQTISVNLETAGVDSTTIDSGGWNSEIKTNRTLTVALEGKILLAAGDAIDPAQNLLKVSGEELGALGTLDIRVWRTDTSEGWEYTANNGWSTGGGDANGLRTFTSNLQSTGEPTRIESVLVDADTDESVPVDEAAYLAVLEPATP